MAIVYPEYYPHFSCLADHCTHTCCRNWRIDIDPQSLERFQNMPGEMGERLRNAIEITDYGAKFRLVRKENRPQEDRYCTFLTEDGLCELVLKMGADVQCKICAEFPRTRLLLEGHTEMGLCTSCEAAGRLILSWKEPVRLIGEIENSNPKEQALLEKRRHIFELLQERSLPLSVRLENIREFCGIPEDKVPLAHWAVFLMGLPQLEKSWGVRLMQLMQDAPEDAPIPEDMEIPFEQLAFYFFHCHLPDSLEKDNFSDWAAFCLLSVRMVAALCRKQCDMDTLVEAARQYDAEIECSPDALKAILKLLTKK